ncbi:MAG: MFS transporter [Flavobacteriales bacterium]|jgi:MFS family permease|nr:MFS transporter [Flavobacteriales bacterium]
MKHILTRTVWALGLISLFTDMASEMLYPVMPLYLSSIGFSVVLIGVLEGVAEATAGLSKGWFGQRSDLLGKRAPFVQWGYALSVVSKPMMALFVAPLWVFFARTVDRLGKGIRTAARDAMLSDASTPASKGTVFGFHRGMDTLGAAIGPALALVFLYFHPDDYVPLFFIAFIPGAIAIALSLTLRDRSASPTASVREAGFLSFLGYWKVAPVPYRKLVIGLLLFALFNSSDMFLLLGAKSAGMSDSATIGAYIFYNLVFALAAFPLGLLADRIGLKKIFLLGLVLFAIVYFGMAQLSAAFGEVGMIGYGALFLLYGLYAAATDGISKAWVVNVARREDSATAIGFLAGLQSLCALVASSLTGLLWYAFGARYAFLATAIVTVMVVAYVAVVVPAPAHGKAAR